MSDPVAMYVSRTGPITVVVVTTQPTCSKQIDLIIAFCQAAGAISSESEGTPEERYIIDFSRAPGLEYLGGYDEFSRDGLDGLLEDLCDPNRPDPPNITDDELVEKFHAVEPNDEAWVD